MMRIKSDRGQGRTFIFFHEENCYQSFIEQASTALSGKVRLVVVEFSTIDFDSWGSFTQDLNEQLKKLDIRQCALVGFGAAGSLVQYLALTFPRMVRLLTLVDSSFRPHPSFGVRILDRIEAFLPLGLPLRWKESGFDAKPLSQRIRCPALIVLSSQASRFIQSQAHEIALRIPSAWVVTLEVSSSVEHFCRLLDMFEGVPVKCPQKNRVSPDRASGPIDDRQVSGSSH